MNKLRINYLKRERLAELAYSGDPSGWAHIRRIFEDATTEIHILPNGLLNVAWWVFLANRQRVGSVAKLYEIIVDVSADARKEIIDANTREQRFSLSSALSSKPIDPKGLRESLQAANFVRLPQLREYQLRNIGTLGALDAGATFSVPGAGKTTEALAYFSLRRHNDTCLLVVAPKNAFAAWEEQKELCLAYMPDQFVRLVGGELAIRRCLDTKPKLMLITYHQFARDNVRDLVAQYLSENDSFIFLDESHKIKRGEAGKIGSSLLSVAHLPRCKLIMSGTPMPNSVEDLVPQFSFLYPEVRATADAVIEYLKPIYVRTTKAELGLKKPTVVLKKLAMRPAQKALYDLLRYEKARDSSLDAKTARGLRAIGASALRMIQVASNPALVASAISAIDKDLIANVLEEGDSPKLEYVTQKARKLASEGKKVLVWSSFVENVEVVANRLADLGAVYIHGGVEAGSEEEENTREEKIKRFHDDASTMVMVANPAAAAEGISLHTVCHHAIYIDRTYNAAQFLQSQDRIHRLGLPENVETTIEILVAKDSVDESVERRVLAKIVKMSEVLNDPSLRVDPVHEDIEDELEQLSELDADDFMRHLRGVQ